MIGSNPVHLTPTFSQGEQAGRFWSQRFFRTLHLLQAETFRKDEAEAFDCVTDEYEELWESEAGGLLFLLW